MGLRTYEFNQIGSDVECGVDHMLKTMNVNGAYVTPEGKKGQVSHVAYKEIGGDRKITLTPKEFIEVANRGKFLRVRTLKRVIEEEEIF